MEYKKLHSAAKRVENGAALGEKIDATMAIIDDVVGGTLGPGGHPVLIERPETDLPPTVTKDGVTVFKAMGFTDPVQQTVFEAYRHAAERTADAAGDGTTTATILAHAIGSRMRAYCDDHPDVSPHAVVKRLERAFRDDVEPLIKKLAIPAKLGTPKGDALLLDVARISANGDADLAKAVMEAYEVTGDAGNITISEESGHSRYEVEEIQGYPLPTGYQDSCGWASSRFLNERTTARCVLKDPLFVLYHGKVVDTSVLQILLENIGARWEEGRCSGNVVIVATAWADTVLDFLAGNFEHARAINVVPLRAPQGAVEHAPLHFLEDLAAVVGAKVYAPLGSAQLSTATFEGLGGIAETKSRQGARHRGDDGRRGLAVAHGVDRNSLGSVVRLRERR
jgi:chaperonin GroEL